tara:strand:- start:1228 stop:1503 length:276 start_codon:yes stop_codon:yes gene_type:complete
MKQTLSGWGGLLAELLGKSLKSPGAPSPIPGSQERTVHHSWAGNTYRANTKRSRDRKARRSGEISARQQRIQRKAAQKLMRLFQEEVKAAA